MTLCDQIASKMEKENLTKIQIITKRVNKDSLDIEDLEILSHTESDLYSPFRIKKTVWILLKLFNFLIQKEKKKGIRVSESDAKSPVDIGTKQPQRSAVWFVKKG
ncbi:hypothetical protein TNCV_1932801 [Trichonephila clavipes]|nr:hypothetical protein TNCV_1932801 [Trichonephila clavipes]